uniref:Uncharacterized protein n=1 Tax=Avena sativa TaxID=4498 RepID=A0ACD5VSC9_AVESA
MLEKEQPTCSVFESLITLEIGNWCSIEDMSVVLRFLQLSPRLEKLTLMHRSHDKGAETNGMSVDVMTFQCPFLESVTIQCSKDDDGIDKLVNVLVVNGISAEVISTTLCEDIKERAHAERIRADEERSKELGIFEKMAKENPEWIDDDPYAMSEPDSEQSEAYSDEYDDDDF